MLLYFESVLCGYNYLLRKKNGGKYEKLINETNNVLNDMSDSVVAAHPEYVKRVEGFNVIVRSEKIK